MRGGIPSYGYEGSKLVVEAPKDNEIAIYEYDLALQPSEAETEEHSVAEGRNAIDLEGLKSTVSFRFEKVDPEARIEIYLKR